MSGRLASAIVSRAAKAAEKLAKAFKKVKK
jgi:hypothetical protein